MFWDSSALIPLILPEARSASLTEQLASGQEITVWWGTPVECLSAIYRRHRGTPIADTVLSAARHGGPKRRRPKAGWPVIGGTRPQGGGRAAARGGPCLVRGTARRRALPLAG